MLRSVFSTFHSSNGYNHANPLRILRSTSSERGWNFQLIYAQLVKTLNFSTFFCIGKFSLRIIIFESHSYIKCPIHSFQTEFLWLLFLEWSCEPAEEASEIFFWPAIYDFDVLISSYFRIAFEPKNGTYPKFSWTVDHFDHKNICMCVCQLMPPAVHTNVRLFSFSAPIVS